MAPRFIQRISAPEGRQVISEEADAEIYDEEGSDIATRQKAEIYDGHSGIYYGEAVGINRRYEVLA